MKYIFYILGFSFLLGCTKPEPDDIGSGGTGSGGSTTGGGSTGGSTGNYTFWIKSDLGVGEISVKVDGTSVGTISHYNSSGVTCGSGDVNITKSPGTYSWSATATGKTWSGTITVEAGKCKTMELTSSGTTGGTTGGGTTGGTTGGGTGGSAPTVTTPNTIFKSWMDYTVSKLGDFKMEQFSISTTGRYVFRFTSQYASRAAIIPQNQYNNFTTGAGYTYTSQFDGQNGTQYVTLQPGTYYIGHRNTSNSANKYSIELDKDITLPSSDKATYDGVAIQGVNSLSTGQKMWHQFTIQSGYRYFLDGCNVNVDFFIIPSNQLSAFQGSGTFQHYTDYEGSAGEAPGLYEIKLAPGTYYLVGRGTAKGSYTYTMERWKVNP